MKINKELLIALVEEYKTSDRFEVVNRSFVDAGRWSLHYSCVIKDKETGKYWEADYSIGATENQDESPFEFEPTDENGDMELKTEVEPYEVTVTKYRKV